MPETPSRFVPVRRADLLPLLLAERGDDAAFARLARVLHHVLRFEADTRAEALHDAYAPFDPDPLVPVAAEGDVDTFLAAAEAVLEEANFRRVFDEELAAAFEERSLFPLAVSVDLAEYDVLRLYRRGMTERDERVRGWSTLWRWRDRHICSYDRLVVVLRMRTEALRGDRTMRMEGMEPDRIYLKSFKNIPTADLEMVLPNTRLRMRGLDRMMVGGPLVAGIGWTLFQSLSVLAAAIAGGFALSLDDPGLKALGGFLLVLAGYLWRTFGKIKTTRLQYLRTLSQGLYFRNLANNRAVLDQLLARALDEEEKEALLAYHFLSRDGAMTSTDLDRRAEAWIRERTGRTADFDVQDGLAGLAGLGVASEVDGVWTAVAPDEAVRRLDEKWDGESWAERVRPPSTGPQKRSAGTGI